jgi:tRNA (mo5U34)-methyltransferase
LSTTKGMIVKMTNYSKDELIVAVERLKPWYHKIDLGQGVITPGCNFEHAWEPIRRLMDQVDYTGKKVLDIGSFDGMWAFEAEKRGAVVVIATDIMPTALEKFLFCKHVLQSKVIPYYNVAPHNLRERLDVFLEQGVSETGETLDAIFEKGTSLEKFDIIQYFGVMYHVRDPLVNLSQIRNVLADDGLALIETGAVLDTEESIMLFNGTGTLSGSDLRIYDDYSTWWAPSVPCLREMLRASLLEPVESSIQTVFQAKNGNNSIGRTSMYARAKAFRDISDHKYRHYLQKTFMNAGWRPNEIG